ncbi:sialidase family protein [Dactylosporangium sp. NPDC000555]|uniref:sialidase family protein n=1 Tax=Dactylosporangium sp. NPDC000555 TaxID=3154260 RepID=UPI00332F134E
MPDLETRLRAERDRLDIDQPPLSIIAARAAALRRRRLAARAGLAGAAALTAVAVAGGALAALRGGDPPAPAVAASDPSGAWSAEGITIVGLPRLPRDLPGSVREAEFLDAGRGFLLTADCCTAWLSVTTDGGETWHTTPSPVAGLPTLVAGADAVTLLGAAPDYPRASTSDGEHWTSSALPPAPPATLTGASRLVPLGIGACGDTTGALAGPELAPVPQQPPITACWWSPVRAGDGSWWVGGRDASGRPAVAVSRDDGSHWSVSAFAGFPASAYARAAMLGRSVHVMVVSPPTEPATGPDRLLGVAQSTDGGATFGPVHPTGDQATIGGDLVPLLDGRLLIVDGLGHWLVSENGGVSWHRLEGLHATMRLARTEGGYIAYGMSTIYTAFSADGSTWQKLDAR